MPELLTQAAAGGTILAGSACPHYLGEAERRGLYQQFIAEGRLPAGHAVDDGVALLWRDGALVDVVSERDEGLAFHVARDGDTAVETPPGRAHAPLRRVLVSEPAART